MFLVRVVTKKKAIDQQITDTLKQLRTNRGNLSRWPEEGTTKKKNRKNTKFIRRETVLWAT